MRESISSLKFIYINLYHIFISSLKKYKDFIIFINEIIYILFIYFLLNKKSVIILEIFEIFKECIELHFYSKRYKIKVIWIDDKSEYQAILKIFLIKKKIESDIIIYYFSEFNEISEYLNRILFNMIHIILFNTNLSNKLWI